MKRSLELDRGQPVEAALASATVVSVIDPAHYRNARLLATAPGLGDQDVALQDRPEVLQGSVVPSDRDAAHRAIRLCVFQYNLNAPRTEPGSSVCVDGYHSDGLASGNRRSEEYTVRSIAIRVEID